MERELATAERDLVELNEEGAEREGEIAALDGEVADLQRALEGAEAKERRTASETKSGRRSWNSSYRPSPPASPRPST